MSNREIPQFESTVAIRPASVPDVESDFAAMGSVFGQISRSALQIGQRLADQQAALEGTEAGQEPGLKLEKPVNEATAAFNRSAISSNKSFLDANIRQSYKELYEKVINPKTFSLESNADGVFNKEGASLAADFLKNALPQNKLAVQNAINYQHGLYLTNIQGKINTRALNAATTNLQNIYNSSKNQAAVTSVQHNIPATGGHYANAMEILKNGERSGLIPGIQVTLDEKDLNNTVHSNQIIGGLMEAVSQGGPEAGSKFIEDVRKAPLPKESFSPLQKDQLIVKLQGMVTDRRTDLDIDQEAVNQRMQKKLEAIERGAPTEVNADIATLKDGGRPIEAEKWQRKIAESRFVAEFYKSNRFTPQVLREKKLQAAINVLASNPSTHTRQLINRLIRGSKEQRKTIMNDPAGYVQASSAYKNTLILNQIARSGVSDATDPNEVTPPLKDNWQLPIPKLSGRKKEFYAIDPSTVSLRIQTLLGVPQDKLRLLSNTQAGTIAFQAMHLNIEDRVALITQIADSPEIRNHKNIFLRTMKKFGIDNMTTGIMAMSKNPESAPSVPIVFGAVGWTNKLYAENQKSVEQTDTVNKTDVGTMVETNQNFLDYQESINNSTNTDMTDYRQEIKDNIMRSAYGLRLANKDPSMEKAVVNASQLLIGNNFQFITIDGKVTRFIKTLPTDELNAQLLQAKKNAIAKGNLRVGRQWALQSLPRGISQSKKQQEWEQNVRQNGYWGALPDTSGVILLDAEKNPVLTLDGQPIIITNTELRNPTSELNQQIDSEPLPGTIPDASAFGVPIPQEKGSLRKLVDVIFQDQNRQVEQQLGLLKSPEERAAFIKEVKEKTRAALQRIDDSVSVGVPPVIKKLRQRGFEEEKRVIRGENP